MSEPFFGLTPVPSAAAAANVEEDEHQESPKSTWSWFGDESDVWQERREAQDTIERYLADLPCTSFQGNYLHDRSELTLPLQLQLRLYMDHKVVGRPGC